MNNILTLPIRYSKFMLLKNGIRSIAHISSKELQSSKTAFSNRKSLMKKDKMAQEYELIYRAPMQSYISIAKNISTVTALLICTSTVYAATNKYKLPAQTFESLGLVSQPSDIWYFAIGFIMVTGVIRIFVSRYPLRIYRAKEKYVAIYDSQIPSRPSKHLFNQGDVKEVSSKFNPWANCTYRLGNRYSLLLSRYFRTPADYNQMLGYN